MKKNIFPFYAIFGVNDLFEKDLNRSIKQLKQKEFF